MLSEAPLELQRPVRSTVCRLDRAGKVPGWKPEVIRKDGQVRILQAAFCSSRSAGGAPVLKTGKPKGHAGSNPVCGAHVGISLTGKAAVC